MFFWALWEYNRVMKQITAFLLSLGLVVAPARALETPESLKIKSAVSLDRLPKFKAAFTGSRYVRLSGNLSLRGSEYLREGSTYITVNLSGTAYLYGGGGIRASNVRVNERISFYLREGQNYISESVRVSERVSIYKNGRYVGSTTVTGTIRVSGWISGNWLRLDGSGTISGSLFVREDDRNRIGAPRR